MPRLQAERRETGLDLTISRARGQGTADQVREPPHRPAFFRGGSRPPAPCGSPSLAITSIPPGDRAAQQGASAVASRPPGGDLAGRRPRRSAGSVRSGCVPTSPPSLRRQAQGIDGGRAPRIGETGACTLTRAGIVAVVSLAGLVGLAAWWGHAASRLGRVELTNDGPPLDRPAAAGVGRRAAR